MGDALLAVVNGLIVPIVVLTGAAVWLYVTRVLVPAVKGNYFKWPTHAIALSAIFSLSAHFLIGAYYGIGRTDPDLFRKFANFVPMIALIRALILAAAVTAICVYNKARFGRENFSKVILVTLVLWLLGVALSFRVYEKL